MSRRETRRATASRTRRRAAGLGVAVPAVVGVGALPAFATHSGGDEGIDEDVDLFSEEEEPDEFGEARLLDADDDLNDGDLDDGEMVEDGYDPFEKDDEEGADEDAEGAEGAEDDEERNRGRERAEEASDGRSSAADDAPGRP